MLKIFRRMVRAAIGQKYLVYSTQRLEMIPEIPTVHDSICKIAKRTKQFGLLYPDTFRDPPLVLMVLKFNFLHGDF